MSRMTYMKMKSWKSHRLTSPFIKYIKYIGVPLSRIVGAIGFIADIYVTKTVKKCLQFVYIFADLLPVKCQTKFLILAVKFLTNCLLPQSIFLKIVC
jgi:hypothetical protein